MRFGHPFDIVPGCTDTFRPSRTGAELEVRGLAFPPKDSYPQGVCTCLDLAWTACLVSVEHRAQGVDNSGDFIGKVRINNV
jgi:hypothetical protein